MRTYDRKRRTEYTFKDASSTFRIIFGFILARRYRDCLNVIPISGFTACSNKCVYAQPINSPLNRSKREINDVDEKLC